VADFVELKFLLEEFLTVPFFSESSRVVAIKLPIVASEERGIALKTCKVDKIILALDVVHNTVEHRDHIELLAIDSLHIGY
jgi:hypothetical protein